MTADAKYKILVLCLVLVLVLTKFDLYWGTHNNFTNLWKTQKTSIDVSSERVKRVIILWCLFYVYYNVS